MIMFTCERRVTFLNVLLHIFMIFSNNIFIYSFERTGSLASLHFDNLYSSCLCICLSNYPQ